MGTTPGECCCGRVLVVDDDESVREALGEALAFAGWCVDTARNGDEALDHLRSGRLLPDLVISDLMMPVCDGYAFRARQAADGILRAIPFVVMTAGGAAEALHPPAAAVLTKPFDLCELYATAEKHRLRPAFARSLEATRRSAALIERSRVLQAAVRATVGASRELVRRARASAR